MKVTEDHEDWIGVTCKTGDKCPVEGYWEQIGTNEISWHEIDDSFAPLTPEPNYQRANYKYIGKQK